MAPGNESFPSIRVAKAGWALRMPNGTGSRDRFAERRRDSVAREQQVTLLENKSRFSIASLQAMIWRGLGWVPYHTNVRQLDLFTDRAISVKGELRVEIFQALRWV
jgi:hypothetical protein